MLDCLKKGLKIANQCMDAMVQTQLFVELLNHYLYFKKKGNQQIEASLVNELISKIKEELPSLENNEESHQISKHFTNTMDHIKSVVSIEECYKDITV